MIKKIWNDPVWSKVIATAIISAVVTGGGYLWHQATKKQRSDKASASISAQQRPVNRFRIAITDLQPVSDEEINETKQLKDRIIESINNRKEKKGIELEIVNVHEVIDPLSAESDIRANKLGQELGAHIVISGRLRHDEELLFRPYIYNFITTSSLPDKIEVPSLIIGPNISHVRKIALKEQNINNMIDLMAYVSAMSQYESQNYYLSAQIMQTIESPSAEHYFFIASALYHAIQKEDPAYIGELSSKLNDVIKQLDKATSLDSQFQEAWFDKAYIQHHRGDLTKALLSVEKAISLDPLFHAAWVAKSLILFDLGKRKEAQAALKHAETLREKENRASK